MRLCSLWCVSALNRWEGESTFLTLFYAEAAGTKETMGAVQFQGLIFAKRRSKAWSCGAALFSLPELGPSCSDR